MDVRFELKTNIKLEPVNKAVKEAAELAMKEVTINVQNDAVKFSPWLTGNNARSITSEYFGLSSLIYSTSGYGGFLETGTVFMHARPYFSVALGLNFTPEIMAELIARYLGEAK